MDTILSVAKVVLPPAKIMATGVVRTAGGMATNAAAAAARLNTVTVTLFSRIGDDVAGEFYRQDLAKEGADLDLSEVQVVPGDREQARRSAQFWILVDHTHPEIKVHSPRGT